MWQKYALKVDSYTRSCSWDIHWRSTYVVLLYLVSTHRLAVEQFLLFASTSSAGLLGFLKGKRDRHGHPRGQTLLAGGRHNRHWHHHEPPVAVHQEPGKRDIACFTVHCLESFEAQMGGNCVLKRTALSPLHAPNCVQMHKENNLKVAWRMLLIPLSKSSPIFFLL